MTVVQDLTTAVKDVQVTQTFIQKHERFLLGVVFAFVTMFSVYKVEQHMDNTQAAKVQELTTQLADQKQIDAAYAKQSAQVQAQYASMVEILSKQNASLAASVTTRNIALQQQQTVDSTLRPTELATRWQDLIHVSGNDVVANANDNFTVSGPAALSTIEQLESVPVLAANYDAEKQIADNTQKELASSNVVVATLNNQIDGLKTELVDQKKADQAEIADIKKKSRVSKLRWFGIGVGAGMAAVLHFVI